MMASTLLRRQFAPSKHDIFRSFSSTSARCRPDLVQPGGRNVFDTHTVEDLHGLPASEILAESGTRADAKLKHFTGTCAMVLWYQSALFIALKSQLWVSMSMRTAYQVIVVSSPQHPAAHGVLRLILELNGEEVLRSDPVSFITSRISVC